MHSHVAAYATILQMPRPKKAESKATTVARKVFFYRVDAGVATDTGQPKVLNFGPAIRHVGKMPFSDDGRYLKSSSANSEKELCCWPDSTRLPYRVRLANIRRGQHPPIENGGNFSPLILGAGGGLAEISHFVLFADGVCGAEFNFYGPRASQLPFYLAVKAPGLLPSFKLASIVRPDLQARLAALNDVKMLDLKVRASFADTLEIANEDLGAALRANIKAVRARPEDEFELRFVRRKSKKLQEQSAPAKLLDTIRNLAVRPEVKEQVSIFKVTGQGGRSQFVDVLHEQFTAEKEIQPAIDSAGAVDTQSMYEAIEEAYQESSVQLTRAQSLE